LGENVDSQKNFSDFSKLQSYEVLKIFTGCDTKAVARTISKTSDLKEIL
jgi:hypothetical protein